MSTLTHKTSLRPCTAQRDDFVSLDGLLTVADWEALPKTKPPYELVEGKLVQKMLATNSHSWAVGESTLAFDKWADLSGWRFFSGGPGIAINEHTGYIPDVMGFTPDVYLDPKSKINPIPTLVSEVVSRETARFDRTTKKENYAYAGVSLFTHRPRYTHARSLSPRQWTLRQCRNFNWQCCLGTCRPTGTTYRTRPALDVEIKFAIAN